MNKLPLFSIIIPTYNRGHIIHRAIESVLDQSCIDWELIIVDDGSNDYTMEIIGKYKNDKRVTLHYQENNGVCSARNKGMSLAQGEYLVFLDSDDALEVNYLATFTELLINTKYDCIFCGVEIRYPGLSEVTQIKTSPESFLTGSFCIRSEVIGQIGGYDENLSYGENTELGFRLKEAIGNDYGIIDQVLLYVYQEKNNRMSNQPNNVINSISYVLEKHQSYFDMNKHSKYHYLNTLGVSYCRIGNWQAARITFYQSVKIRPTALKGHLRMLCTFIPGVAKMIY